MITIFYLLGYLALIGFIVTSFLKIRAYMSKTPSHIRWELYPIPHEGKRAAYGGSYMEEVNWWEHKHTVDHMGDIYFLLREILFLEATFHHNRPLWYRTYPFHVGLYLLMGGAIILVIAAILRLLGCSPDGWLIGLIYWFIQIMSFVGCVCLLYGGIGLMVRRLTDEGLRMFSTFEHFFSIGLFAMFGLTGLITWLTNASFASCAGDFVYNALTLNFVGVGSGGFIVHMLLGFFLMILIPVSFMSHILLKYFLYHDIRWEDIATCTSTKRQAVINDILQYKCTWAAPHINPKGEDKTWVQVATSGYPCQEGEK